MKKTLLIDGNALMYKAFYASSIFLQRGAGFDDAGNPVNALRTFAMMMLKLRQKFDSKYVLVAFDQKDLKTYRTEHDFYKDKRKPMPQELIYQIPLIMEFLQLFGFKSFSHPELEADDIIGILSNHHAKEGYQVNIVTSDKDLLQLVKENVTVYLSKTGVSDMVEYNNDNFCALCHGLSPSQIKDLKGIMGDSSDNLKGIKGIGEKGAITLLNKYGTLEEVIKNKDDLSNALRMKISDGSEHGLLCKNIATIITEKDLSLTDDDICLQSINKNELVYFLKRNSV